MNKASARLLNGQRLARIFRNRRQCQIRGCRVWRRRRNEFITVWLFWIDGCVVTTSTFQGAYGILCLVLYRGNVLPFAGRQLRFNLCHEGRSEERRVGYE